jgi:hypothetical protein
MQNLYWRLDVRLRGAKVCSRETECKVDAAICVGRRAFTQDCLHPSIDSATAPWQTGQKQPCH